MKLAKGMLLAALAAWAVASPSPARATGKIRSVDVYDPEGVHSFPNPQAPLAAGDTFRVRFRLVNLGWAQTVWDASYANPWVFCYTGPLTGDAEADERTMAEAEKPRLGLWIGGQLREADCANWPMGVASDWLAELLDGERHYTDLVFEYTVRPGDLAPPVQLANEAGTGPAKSGDRLYMKCNGRETLWKMVDARTHSATNELAFGPSNLYDDPDFAVEALSGWSQDYENRDYDLSGAGVHVRGVDFDPAFFDGDAGVWRSIAQGSTAAEPAAPSIRIGNDDGDGALDPLVLYLWTADTNVAEIAVGGAVDDVRNYVFPDGVTRKVGRLRVAQGDRAVPFGVKATGDVGDKTQLFLAPTPTNGVEAARARVPFGLLGENPAVVFVEPALDGSFGVDEAIAFKVLGYKGRNSEILTLRWQCAGTQLSTGYSAPANNTTEATLAFREAGDHRVTVTVADQDGKSGTGTIVVHVVEPPESIQSFSVTNSYAPPPAVTLSTPDGLATFSEGSTGPEPGRIDVGLTARPTADITVHLDVRRIGTDTGNYPLPELSSYNLEFGSGSPTNQSVYFEWLDGTPAGATDGYLLTAFVTNATAGPSGVAWKDLYAPGAMTNFVANEAPQITSFAPTDASPVVAGVPFRISYSLKDVPADFSAGLLLTWTTSEGFTTSYQVTATGGDNYATNAATSPPFTFSSSGPHSVSLVVEDKDQGTSEAVFDVTVLPPPVPPSVSNVVARQRWPWNGLVDVDYEVGGSTNLLANLTVQITFVASDGRSWTATNFLAGAEPSAEPGAHRATWNAAADAGAGVVASNVVATVALVRAPTFPSVPRIRAIVGETKAVQLFVVPEGEELNSANALLNEDFYVYAPLAGSDSVSFTLAGSGESLANGHHVNSGENMTILVSVKGLRPVRDVAVGTSKTSDLSDVVIHRVIDFYDSDGDGDAVASAASAEFRLDTREGPFESDGTETLAYSTQWHPAGDATVTILQSGAAAPVASGLFDEGDAAWQVFEDGTYVLTHRTMAGGTTVSDEETATFVVRGLTPVEAALRWKFAKNANGWYCAQVALKWHPPLLESIENMRLLFADRTDAQGRRTAYLVDPATVAGPLPATEEYGGTTYRVAPVDLSGFAELADGARAVYGVSDETMDSTLAVVPPAERKICLRVANLSLSTVERVDNKLAILAWNSGSRTNFLPLAETMSSSADDDDDDPQPAPRPAPRPLSVAEANLSAAFGLAPAAVARAAVICRVSSMAFAGDGSIEGTFEIAAEDAGVVVAESGELAPDAKLAVLGAASLGGSFKPLDPAACGVELLSRKPPYAFRVKAPGDSAFFKVRLEAGNVFE